MPLFIHKAPERAGYDPGSSAAAHHAQTVQTPMITDFEPNSDCTAISVLLVDDQELVRSGLRHILRRADGFAIVGEAGDGSEVLAAVAHCRPDVVIMDIRMRHVSGIEATRQLSATNGPPVLALSMFDDDDLLAGVLHAGAAGFVLKHSSAEELIRAVRSVARGEAYLDPAVTDRVLRTYRQASAPAPIQHATPALTARERDVLALVARGLTNAEIAEALSISNTTVKSHIGRIFVKLELRDRQAAIVYAYNHGIVTINHAAQLRPPANTSHHTASRHRSARTIGGIKARLTTPASAIGRA